MAAEKTNLVAKSTWVSLLTLRDYRDEHYNEIRDLFIVAMKQRGGQGLGPPGRQLLNSQREKGAPWDTFDEPSFGGGSGSRQGFSM